jgi:signal transduction histidine kinase
MPSITQELVAEHDAALETIGKFVEALHDVDSPFEFATTLVKATAQHYNADIATLFRVSPSKTELVAEAGYDQKGELLQARAIYSLPWDAASEANMPAGGLTAWVAVSGRPLFIKSPEELLDKHLHPAHRGAWDQELHPTGPDRTFGCLYAVPLRAGQKEGKQLKPHDSVLGVYKIERRKDNQAGIFTAQQIQEFNMLARQFTLVITLYERAMLRILSDARHAVAGRLADTIPQLDIVTDYLNELKAGPSAEARDEAADAIDRIKDDAGRVLSWLRQALQTYSHPLDRETRSLKDFLTDTLAARAVQQTPASLHVATADARERLPLVVSQSWDLHTVLLSLLNNAMRHSGAPDSVSLVARIMRSEDGKAEEAGEALPMIVFTVEDKGKGLSHSVVEAAKTSASAGSSESLTAPQGTGLRRVFRVCAFRKWRVRHYDCKPGTGFEIRVPAGP